MQLVTALDDEGLEGRLDDLRDWVRGRPAQIREVLSLRVPAGAAQSLDCTNLDGER